MLAGMTGFARGEEAINLDPSSSVPLGFVFQLSDELAPSHIADSFCECMVLDHVLDRQALDADHLVFVNNTGRKFVLVVMTLVVNASMHAGDFESRFSSV